jgi:hypothetical protein
MTMPSSPQLVSLLEADAVPLETLHARYGSLLELVRKLIGVVPNCDPYLEIWPTAFRTYNVMVPNFLNLPPVLWGLGVRRDLLGLALYASSRTAACAYCSAHTCSFALRRGAETGKVAHATDDDLGGYTPVERATIVVARAMSRVPAQVGDTDRSELGAHLSVAHVEWIALGVSMMGFLNKFMDALAVPLEKETLGEVSGVLASSGWTPGKHSDASLAATGEPPRPDSLFTRISVLRQAPAALSLDKQWTAGVPDRWPAVGQFLESRTGFSFPVLSRLSHARAVRALATMLRDNLDPAASIIGLPAKLAAGAIYADVVGDAALSAEIGRLGTATSDARVDVLARAISPSPAQVDAAVVEACRPLPAAAIVEVVTFVSVMQLVHRLEAFYPVSST